MSVRSGQSCHDPEQVAGLFRRVLSDEYFMARLSDTLNVFLDDEYLSTLGHTEAVFGIPEARELMRRDMLWAASGGGSHKI